MVMKSQHTDWRKKYFDSMYEIIFPILTGEDPYPEELILPVSSKFSLCEFGGSKYSSGIAMLIATPSGFPNSAISLMKPKPNGVHAVSRIWTGSLIAIAHHQFGYVNIAIYQVIKFLKTPNGDNQACFRLLTGIKNKSSVEAHDLRWLSPYDRKYQGLKKLTKCALTKLELYNCDTPIYLEPLRILKPHEKDVNLLKLIDKSPVVNDPSYSDLVPRYARIMKHINKVEEYVSYANFENAILNICLQYHHTFPFIYVLLAHHVTIVDEREELQTHAFIIVQESAGKNPIFHSPGLVYRHVCNSGKSVDMESYIQTNYNYAYQHILLGVRGKGLQGLLHYISTSKDGCHYVPLKYSLCTLKYHK